MWTTTASEIETQRQEAETERKFHTWSATTVRLLLDAQDAQEKSRNRVHMTSLKSQCVNKIINIVGPLIREAKHTLSSQLFVIISRAYELDQEIGQQVARITLQFPTRDSVQFFPEAMELEKGVYSECSREVCMVVAPGVLKQGKSTGEGFDDKILLLKSIVSCI